MAAKRGTKSQSKSKNSASKKTRAKADSKANALRDEVIVLCTIAFSIILLLSNFHFAGSVGEVINDVMFGIFGVIEYILPIVIAGSVLFLIANKKIGVIKVKMIAVNILMLLLCGLLQLIVDYPQKSATLASFYTYAAQNNFSGGFVGGVLCKLLSPFGTGGSYVIFSILIIICLIIITEKSFIGGMKSGSTKVYQSARQDYASYRQHSEQKRKQQLENRAKQAEEKLKEKEAKRVNKAGKSVLDEYDSKEEEDRILRMENKVRGVAINTMIPKEDTLNPIDIHEITVDYNREDEYSDDIYDPQEQPKTAKSKKRTVKAQSMHEIQSEQQEDIDEYSNAIEQQTELEQRRAVQDFEMESIATAEDSVVKDILQNSTYIFPPIELLGKNSSKGSINIEKENRATALRLQQTLQNFGVKVTITDISCGPSVTRYELQPEQGVKVSKIVSLSDDIKLNLAAADIRIEAPIPGKAAIGIEVPNKETTGVTLRELLESDTFKKHPSSIAFATGRDIAGKIIVADIAKMPHLLIAGATGSGKSVCINTIIMSILYKAKPEDVKLIMVDPKVVELSVYNGIPHLMIPVVTDPKKASGALNWAVAEMTDRYKKFAEHNVRDLKGYNEKILSMHIPEGEERPKKMPQIVIIIDELADLMMVAPGEVEDAICRLAQLARAAGIHLIIATQRPSVNVITGLIKANVPSRIAFSVSSGVDSRTIIDMNGAEKLLGKGDMLFYPSGYQKPVRVQGAFVTDKEVGSVVSFLKEHLGDTAYDEEITTKIEAAPMNESQAFGGDRDAYFAEAGRFIIEKEKGSIGMLQRYYKIGFNRAARIMDQLADAGVVGPEEGTKPRKILMTLEEFEQLLQ